MLFKSLPQHRGFGPAPLTTEQVYWERLRTGVASTAGRSRSTKATGSPALVAGRTPDVSSPLALPREMAAAAAGGLRLPLFGVPRPEFGRGVAETGTAHTPQPVAALATPVVPGRHHEVATPADVPILIPALRGHSALRRSHEHRSLLRLETRRGRLDVPGGLGEAKHHSGQRAVSPVAGSVSAVDTFRGSVQNGGVSNASVGAVGDAGQPLGVARHRLPRPVGKGG